MTITAFLHDLHAIGVHLAADGNDLLVDAPRGVMTPNLQAALVAHKAELLAHLLDTKAPAPHLDQGVSCGDPLPTDLWRHDVCPFCFEAAAKFRGLYPEASP
jgi:hypothetical protein